MMPERVSIGIESLTQRPHQCGIKLSCFDLHWFAIQSFSKCFLSPSCVPGMCWPPPEGRKGSDTEQVHAGPEAHQENAAPGLGPAVGRVQQKAVRVLGIVVWWGCYVSIPGTGASAASGARGRGYQGPGRGPGPDSSFLSGTATLHCPSPGCAPAPCPFRSLLSALIQGNFMTAHQGSYPGG